MASRSREWASVKAAVFFVAQQSEVMEFGLDAVVDKRNGK